MKKFYKIFLLISILVILSTYSSKELKNLKKDSNTFFTIKNIKIENNLLIQEMEIKNRLNSLYKENIFFVNKNDIEVPLKKIDFFKEVEVKKKYPNTIIVKVYETEPVAIVFINNIKKLIDSSSNLIEINKNYKIDKLPSVFGINAEKNIINFINKLKKNNFLYKDIKNFYYFQINRWDLQLINNKTIKLPHQNVDQAIIKSIELLNSKDFKEYNIIDLRMRGKIVVE